MGGLPSRHGAALRTAAPHQLSGEHLGMRDLGVAAIIATAAVGVCTRRWPAIVSFDQFIDFTKNRRQTF